ncbi:MAG: hypothetical protein N2510_08140 [Ignavibacteria bacterium]|nr:hypothetical protein [Ignavibacteria bacterium]
MKEIKLQEILKSLSQSDFRKLGEFLHSPFHNKSRKIIELYNYLKNFYPELDSRYFKAEVISQNIFNNKKKTQNARTLMSSFTALTEKFLIYNQLEKNLLLQKNLLIEALYRKDVNKPLNQEINEVSRLLRKEFNKDIDFYYHEFIFKALVNNIKGTDLDLNMDKDYLNLSEISDKLFILSKLKIANTILSRKIIPDTKYEEIWSIKDIIDFSEKNISEIMRNHPMIFSEFNILMMMTKPEKQEYFLSLRDYVFKNINRFSYEELSQVYYSLTNYCVNKISIGETRYLANLYSIHTFFEKAGFYRSNRKIQYTDFLAVIICGINNEKLEWSKYFLSEYKDNIVQSFKNDTVMLARAVISFAEKKYDDALDNLSQVSYRYSYFYLKSKEIYIKIYYETKNFTALTSVIDATRQYLKRHKEILAHHYERFNLFLSNVLNLIKLDDKDKTEIAYFLRKLDRDRHTIAREWLIEKTLELK